MSRQRKMQPNVRYFRNNLKEMMAHIEEYPVTFIGAPPSFGKTVLLESVQNSKKIHMIKMKLTGRDELVEHIDKLLGIEGNASIADIEAFDFRSAYELLLKMIERAESTIIMIDDIHLIEGEKEIADILFTLACSSHGFLHFVISSRNNLWDRKSMSVAKGSVSLITPDMMLLNSNDIMQYFMLCGIRIDRRQADDIKTMTDGWILPLHMMVNEFMRSGKLALFKDNRDLLYNLMINNCSRDELKFMSSTALMEHFTIARAERLRDEGYFNRTIIEDLIYHNAFVIYYPDRDEYNIISVFKETLIENAEKNGIPVKEYLQNAGDITFADGLYTRAARYYHRAGNYDMMMRAIEEVRRTGNDDELLEKYIEYYRDCPEEVRRRYHDSMLYLYWKLIISGKGEMIAEADRDLSEYIVTNNRIPEEEKNSLRCDYYLFRGVTEFEDSRRILEDYYKALKYYDGVRRENIAFVPMTFGATSIMRLFNFQGKVDDVADQIGDIMEVASKMLDYSWEGIYYEAKAEAAMMVMDLKTAEIMLECAERELKGKGDLNSGLQICIDMLHTLIAMAEGDHVRVNSCVRRMLDNAEHYDMWHIKMTAEIFYAWVKAQMQSGEWIAEWLRRGGFDERYVYEPALPSIYILHMYILYATRKVKTLLSYEEVFFGRKAITSNDYLRQEAAMLIAAGWYYEGRTHRARHYLEMAFSIAEITGNIAALIWFGEPLVPLMASLPEEYGNMVGKILPMIQTLTRNREKCRNGLGGRSLLGLTRRESEVAGLAASGMINREIAEELHISENTVKTTLQRVFSKLDIKSRRQLTRILSGDDISQKNSGRS